MIPLLLIPAIIILLFNLYNFSLMTKKTGGLINIPIRITTKFIINQTIYIGVIVLFLIALDPVPALLAIAAVLGVLMNAICSLVYHSAKVAVKEMESVEWSTAK